MPSHYMQIDQSTFFLSDIWRLEGLEQPKHIVLQGYQAIV